MALFWRTEVNKLEQIIGMSAKLTKANNRESMFTTNPNFDNVVACENMMIVIALTGALCKEAQNCLSFLGEKRLYIYNKYKWYIQIEWSAL